MDAVAAIAEVIAWVAFPAALVIGAITLAVGLARGPWASAPAVIVGEQVRWFSPDGLLHVADADEVPDAASDDSLVIHYRPRFPRHCHPEPVAHDERAGRTTAIVLAAIGAVAALVSTVASLV